MAAQTEEPTVLFGKSKWIWAADCVKRYSHVVMRRHFTFGTDKPPSRAFCRAACDTHYYLFVNGNAAVWMGGYDRGGKGAYYDEFDIAKYLVKGDNVIVCYCQYFGTDGAGRDLVPSSRAGFIFECNDLNIFSDETFEVYENRAYKPTPRGNCCYAGRSILYDASLEGQIQNVLDPQFKSSLFVPATVLGAYPDDVMGVLQKRPMPMERFSAQPVIGKPRKTTDQFDGDTYTIALPRMMRVTPYFEVTGNGQEKIVIKTDRTDCQGCFGDETSTYVGHKVEYTTKPTINIFECLLPMTGQTLTFSMPRTVKVIKLGYREIGCAVQSTCEFKCERPELNVLFGKALNTLYACMGSTLMDTPERERTMWLGDASIEARATYLGYADGAALVKKVIDDVLGYADGDVLYSCVPGNIPVDIPAHGLLALGEFGLFAQYKNFAADGIALLRSEYTRLCDYLMLWEMTERGVLLRDGNRRWYDNLYNVDEILIENALYYSACAFLRELGGEIGDREYDETFDDRMSNIADFIENAWDGVGYTAQNGAYDDRANALITLCGLVPNERKGAIARLLAATHNASPYLEWTVTEALCKLGRRDLALKRFIMRNALDAKSEDGTLGEDYAGYGTKCQGFRTSIVFEILQDFGGLNVGYGGKRIRIAPDFVGLGDFRYKVALATGEIEVRAKYTPTRVDILVDNRTSSTVELEIVPECVGRNVERKTIVLNKGKNKFSV